MKNLFIVKRIVENMNLSDSAFSVWCGLRNIMHKDQYEYFITYDVGVKTINKFNPIPYSTLKNSYFVVYRRGLGNI